MEGALAQAFLALVQSGALKGAGLFLVILCGAAGILAVRTLKLGWAYLEQRKGHDQKSETQMDALGTGVASLTAELKAGREASTRDLSELRLALEKNSGSTLTAVSVVASRVEQLETRLIQAVGTEGEETRAALADRRMTDATRAAERAATAALVVASGDVDASAPSSAPEDRRSARPRLGSRHG